VTTFDNMPDQDSMPDQDRIPRKHLDSRVRNYRSKTLVAGPSEPRELSESATFIWKLMDGKRSVAELAGALCVEYDIDRASALDDVADLILTLSRAGILTY
jgi:Coenzyme PQQ synthesis protein D (PqqD)